MSEERLRELEGKYEGFKVYDNRGERVGKVDDLFVDETDREEYIGVKVGFLGLKSTLIPMDIVRVDGAGRAIEVSESKENIKDAPTFDDDDDITPEYEDGIRSHFGLESLNAPDRGSYGAYPRDTSDREEDRTGTGEREDTEPLGETGDREQPGSGTYPKEREGAAEPLSEPRDEERREAATGQRPEGYETSSEDSGATAEPRSEETEGSGQGGRRTRIRRRVRVEEEYDEESESR